MNSPVSPLPLPDFFDPNQFSRVTPVPYQQRAQQAATWAKHHQISPAATDHRRVCLLLIDVQNTFCLPEFELFVAGSSGQGAIADNQRLGAFIYRHLHQITEICVTLDTHQALQIFHPLFWINADGEHPAPASQITVAEVKTGRWRINPIVSHHLPGYDSTYLQAYALHYVQQLAIEDKLQLTIWPYHAMLGGIGHALVSGIEEAVFFHGIARETQPHIEIKGRHPLTENYSVFAPEVTHDHENHSLFNGDRQQENLANYLLDFDQILVAGQAKSHCVAWSVRDLIAAAVAQNPPRVNRITLLEDCMSPVVIPGTVDFTHLTETLFQKFGKQGCQRTQTTTVFGTEK